MKGEHTGAGIRDYTKMKNNTKQKDLTDLDQYIRWLIRDSILSARKEKGYTQEQLAEKLNCIPFDLSVKAVQSYELEKKSARIPKTVHFLYIAAVMDIDLNKLRDEIKERIVTPTACGCEKF